MFANFPSKKCKFLVLCSNFLQNLRMRNAEMGSRSNSGSESLMYKLPDGLLDTTMAFDLIGVNGM